MPEPSIRQFLRDAHVPYSIVPHLRPFTAQEETAAVHVPGRNWAKVVICLVDGEPIEAVVPAPMIVGLARLLELARGKAIRLAREEELHELFPDCEPGAMPPFGPMYGQRVYVDVSLAAERDLVFYAGTHTAAIAMRWADFAAAVRPIIGCFAERATNLVGAFRLSHRE